jgi:hypothetical protein
MLMHSSENKEVTTDLPNVGGAYFPYNEEWRNAWILIENASDRNDPVEALVQIWGLHEASGSWYVVDAFSAIWDHPVGQFLSWPLSFAALYVQELPGSTTTVKVMLTSDAKVNAK